MQSWQSIAALGIFVAVIGVITFEWLHLTIAAMLGALLLVVLNILTLEQAIGYIAKNHSPLVLLFGVMVMVRAFQPTRLFEYLATKMVLWTEGKGSRLLLGIVGITAPISTFLPNATTVMLLAPLIPPLAQELEIDFVPLLILMVFVANSAGLLSLVGDPATFIIGSAIKLSFTDYFQRLSFGGLIAVLAIVVLLPVLFRSIWQKQLPPVTHLPPVPIAHPRLLILGGMIVGFVLVFFVVGEMLPVPISPATVALLGASLCLLLAHQSKIASVNQILRDVDWSTLLFFMSMFVLIGGLQKTGVISSLSALLAVALGQNIAVAAIVLLFSVGLLSSVVPNLALVVAFVPLLQEYLVDVGWVAVGSFRPGADVTLPPAVLPLFYALIYGATLGGNGTLVGASANIVAAGIAEQQGRPIAFRRFLRYGLPLTLFQLLLLGLYVGICFLREGKTT
jgi:Na+/H+ antiporter NhaD/arsenite permease-like protein